MELFFFRHAEYDRLYNCTGLEINSIPLERRQFVPESIAVCVLCAIYYVLYVPCMCSLWKHMRDNSCYKLLFYIGITDLAILWVPGFFCGLANLCGAVFCSCPTLMYFVGMSALALWVAESSADLILAFNRCLDLVSPRFSHILFSGHRTSLWITGCFLYALYWVFFMKPILYSSIYFGWFFYPFVGYRTGDDQHEYEQWLHRVHNIAVAFLTPLIYLIFAAKLFYDVRKNRRQFGIVLSEMGAVQIRIFAQVFLVSLINTFSSFLYVYLQSNEVNQWMITLAEFAWSKRMNKFVDFFYFLIQVPRSWYRQFFLIFIYLITPCLPQGLPPVLYLAFNKTIRADCRLMFVKLFQSHRIDHIGVVTVVRPKITRVNGASRNCAFCKDYPRGAS